MAGPADTRDDDALMAEVQKGQSAALAVLFDRHHGRVFGYFRRLGQAPAPAEDLTQEVFLRVLRLGRSYRPRGRFVSWLLTVAHRVLCASPPESAHAPLERAVDVAAPGTLPLEAAERAERTREVREALAGLPLPQRAVIVLGRYQGLTYEEIGSVLGCSAGAARVRAHRALCRLAELLPRDTESSRARG